jgi:hypothetical protein
MRQNLKAILLSLFSMLTLNVVTAQIQSFKVMGDINKFYVVTFKDGGSSSNMATELELGRSNVSLDTSWRGSMIAKIRYHVGNWGHGSGFIDVDLRESNSHFPSNSYFIAGWTDPTVDNGSLNIILWLRGNTTYFYKSNYPVSPLIYDGSAPQNSLSYTPGTDGTIYSVRAAIDPYVNTYGMTYGNTAYFNGVGVNYFGGSLGIGTRTPGTNKLAVEGTIGARRVKVTQVNPWPDYVFEPAYKMPSLQELEAYIKENKHLPDVPTAKEVAKDGVDVGEMNRILLQKIEELTLHLIEQQKELNEMKLELKMLKNANQ